MDGYMNDMTTDWMMDGWWSSSSWCLGADGAVPPPLSEGCTELTTSMDGVKMTSDGIFIIDGSVAADSIATVSDIAVTKVTISNPYNPNS